MSHFRLTYIIIFWIMIIDAVMFKHNFNVTAAKGRAGLNHFILNSRVHLFIRFSIDDVNQQKTTEVGNNQPERSTDNWSGFWQHHNFIHRRTRGRRPPLVCQSSGQHIASLLKAGPNTGCAIKGRRAP